MDARHEIDNVVFGVVVDSPAQRQFRNQKFPRFTIGGVDSHNGHLHQQG